MTIELSFMGGRFRPRFWPSLVTLLFVSALLGLGIWQLERREWKHDLIATLQARQAQAPLALPQPLPPDPTQWDWRKVTLRGEFMHDREMHLLARSEAGGLGYHILTPLRAAGGQVYLVDRGFVPEARKDPATRAEGQVRGEAAVSGTLRLRPGRQWFSPVNDAARNMWFYPDYAAMAQFAGVENLPPLLIEADETPNPGGLPQGGQTRMNFSDNHLMYALFWLAGAFICAVIFVMAHWRKDNAA